ncbi:MAG: hypothetical protein AB7V56_11620 [Candidatus Nitrosocosmicus sp.]
MKNDINNKKKTDINRKSFSNTNSELSNGLSNVVNGNTHNGSPLNSPTKEFMESRFGYDF